MNTKICKKCLKTKEINEYYKNKGVCKLCMYNNKKQCNYCSKFFTNIDYHEKSKHSNEEIFKFNPMYICNDCNKCFPVTNFNHYSHKCKECYNNSRKKEKKKCDKCYKMFNSYYFIYHKCKGF